MDKKKILALAVLGAGVGFLVGFMWGQGTRQAMPGATSTSFSGGVFTMQVNAGQALENGLASLFS